MLRFCLRQSFSLWGIISFLLASVLLFGRFLPAEEMLLLGTEDGVYLQQANQRHFFFDEPAYPEWSPDGAFVALQTDGRFVLSDAASRLHFELSLQESERFVYRPVWSDDSQKIAVLVEEAIEGNFRLLIVDCQTKSFSEYDFPSGQTVLLWWESANTLRFVTATRQALWAWEFQPARDAQLLQRWRFPNYMVRDAALNPDKQGFILPAITTNLQNFELYDFDMTGSFNNISNRATHNDTNPLWSPDGNRMAYRALGDSIQFIILQEAGQEERIVGRFDDVFIRDMQWFDNQTLSLISSYSGRSSYCSLDILNEISVCGEPGIVMFGLSWRPH